MLLRDLGDARALFASMEGVAVGVGMSAFSRIAPAYFLEPYHIVCCRATRDLPLLKIKTDIICLEEMRPGFVAREGFNSAHLLAAPEVLDRLGAMPSPKTFLVYQNYPQMQSLARSKRWVLAANAPTLRIQVGSRVFFKHLVKDLGLPEIPGGIFPIREIAARSYGYWREWLGEAFVVQLTDISQGGGRGTFFIRASEDYVRLVERLVSEGLRWRGISLKAFAIHRFLPSIPASAALCITSKGVLCSGVQRQLVDLPYCRDLAEDGVFCGHAWGENMWPLPVVRDVEAQAHRIGSYLARMGYKGILGVDFLVEEEGKGAYAIEVNPRFTGAFPMLSLLHLKEGVIPMEVFHMLEFQGVSFEADTRELNARYARSPHGSHLLVFLLSEKPFLSRTGLEPGLYEQDSRSGAFSRAKDAMDYSDISNDRQFVVVEGPPAADELPVPSDPMCRICRLLFGFPVVDEQGSISEFALAAADWVRGRVLEEPE